MWPGLSELSTRSASKEHWTSDEDQAFKIRSALCQFELKGNLHDYAGTHSEKHALLSVLEKQGLVRRSQPGKRTELTRSGRKYLRLASKGGAIARLSPWRRLAMVRTTAIVASVAFMCGGSAVWFSGIASSNLASGKGALSQSPSLSPLEDLPYTSAHPDAPAAAPPGVAPHPLRLRSDEDAMPETAIPAQRQAGQPPSASMQEQKEDRAVAQSREEGKRVSHKRNRPRNKVRYEGRARSGFGATPWFFGMN